MIFVIFSFKDKIRLVLCQSKLKACKVLYLNVRYDSRLSRKMKKESIISNGSLKSNKSKKSSKISNPNKDLTKSK